MLPGRVLPLLRTDRQRIDVLNFLLMSATGKFKIGDIEITPNLVLAPMAGVTDSSFRRLIKELGGVGLIDPPIKLSDTSSFLDPPAPGARIRALPTVRRRPLSSPWWSHASSAPSRTSAQIRAAPFASAIATDASTTRPPKWFAAWATRHAESRSAADQQQTGDVLRSGAGRLEGRGADVRRRGEIQSSKPS